MPRPVRIFLAGLAVGCGTGAPSAPVPVGSAPCTIGEGERTRTVLQGAARGADTTLLNPARAGTPIAFDCTGRPRARVATAWSRDSAGTAWTLTVPDAAGAMRTWRERPAADAALRSAGAVSLVPLDARRLVVSFAASQADVPPVFADLALALPAPSSATLQVIPSPGGDLRNALDSGADVVLAAEPPVLEYARGRTGWSSHALPWNRSYVLLARAPLPLEIAEDDTLAFRQALARDVVTVAARPAESPFWWERESGCTPAPEGSGTPAPLVLFPEGDDVARSLAARIVAVASVPGLVAEGRSDAALRTAVARGQARAFVLPLPRQPLVACHELVGGQPDMLVIPLIETRPTALVRAGAGRFTVDYDGGLLPASGP